MIRALPHATKTGCFAALRLFGLEKVANIPWDMHFPEHPYARAFLRWDTDPDYPKRWFRTAAREGQAAVPQRVPGRDYDIVHHDPNHPAHLPMGYGGFTADRKFDGAPLLPATALGAGMRRRSAGELITLPKKIIIPTDPERRLSRWVPGLGNDEHDRLVRHLLDINAVDPGDLDRYPFLQAAHERVQSHRSLVAVPEGMPPATPPAAPPAAAAPPTPRPVTPRPVTPTAAKKERKVIGRQEKPAEKPAQRPAGAPVNRGIQAPTKGVKKPK